MIDIFYHLSLWNIYLLILHCTYRSCKQQLSTSFENPQTNLPKTHQPPQSHHLLEYFIILPLLFFVPLKGQQYSIGMMRHILQAKVNVLIQNNRIQQQKKEKDRLLVCKVKVKDSFSQYQEPSKKSRVKEVKVVRINDDLDPPEDKDMDDTNLQEIYEKRFSEIQKQKYQKIPIEELKKEQQYYIQIIENIHKKIQEKAEKKTQKQVSCFVSRKGSVEKEGQTFHNERQKENMEGQKKRNQKLLQRSKAERRSQEWQETLHEKQVDDVRLMQLKNEYGHLLEEMKRFSGGSEESWVNESLEVMAEGLEKQSNDIQKVIKERKREIINLNFDIVNNGKVLVKEEHIETNEDGLQQIQSNFEELQILIHKTISKNNEKSQQLKDLIQQNQTVLGKIKELDSQKNALNSKQTQDTLPTNSPSTIKTNLTDAKSPSRTKLKHRTTLEMQGNSNLQQHHTSLLKKKQAIAKSIKREDRRWKTLFTQKMKQLVSQYSKLKEINNLGLRIQTQLHGKAEQMVHLRGKHSMTQYHD